MQGGQEQSFAIAVCGEEDFIYICMTKLPLSICCCTKSIHMGRCLDSGRRTRQRVNESPSRLRLRIGIILNICTKPSVQVPSQFRVILWNDQPSEVHLASNACALQESQQRRRLFVIRGRHCPTIV